jgi:stage V sporulation protein G
MEITEIRFSMRNDEKLRAFANVTFDNSFVIRGLKVINGSRGYFVSMPSRRRPDGTYQDMAHPINTEMRHHLEQAVLEAYNREIALFERQHHSSSNN